MKLKCQKVQKYHVNSYRCEFSSGKCPRVSYPKWELAVGGNCPGGNFPIRQLHKGHLLKM